MTQDTAVSQDAAQRADDATVGEDFAVALAAKDRDRLVALLADQIDFEALTPRRHWVATTSTEAVDDVILGLGCDPMTSFVRSAP